jgi:hypothetical protein
MSKRSTQPLVEALAVYDASQPIRSRAWDTLGDGMETITNDDVRALVEADRKAVDAVCLAFYEVTSDRNTLNNCMLCDITYMRKIAELGEI